ncbi:MAG: enoyl-CoA hydratase/isomerase family protein [Syntrophobacteraceae bacterium]
MNSVIVSRDGDAAAVCLARGKVNALNDGVVRELSEAFLELEKDEGIRAVILTGSGKFFSFGFDIPEFLSYTKDAFLGYLDAFAKLYLYLFRFPKPIIAALNGHTIAGGCMLAIACDYRVMAEGKAKISLNEIGFGSSVFAGSVEMLRYCVGSKNAQEVLFSGRMYSAHEAHGIGLVDETAPEECLMPKAAERAREYGAKDPAAFAGIKKLLREPVSELILRREADSLKEFVDIWYSERTWKNLESIRIN